MKRISIQYFCSLNILLLVSALVFSGFNSTAQIKEITSVPSPDVANLGTFGNVPIGHFTGTPDISVPLYTLKAGAFTLPLTARYHVNNVKPHNPPSTLGIGWSLFAGGYIARTIKGVPDEKIEDTDSVGYMYNFDKLKQIDESQDKTLAMRNIVTLSTDNNSHKKWFELSADEFVFNFNGYSGSFFLDKNGEWKVTSSTPIKIEFDKNNGFRKINSFRDKLDIRYYNVSDNKIFIDKFTIITPDGSRYEFGGQSATEFCIPYYNQTNGTLASTCWRLSKIITPDKRIINFEYAADTFMCDIHYAPQLIVCTEGNRVVVPPIQNRGRSGFSGFLTIPSRITKITSDDITIDFDYSHDTSYGEKFLTTMGCLYWSSQDARYSHSQLEDAMNRRRFCQLLGVSIDGNEGDVCRRIASKISHHYLNGIYIHTACNDSIGVRMTYQTVTTNQMLSKIDFCISRIESERIEEEDFVDNLPAEEDPEEKGLTALSEEQSGAESGELPPDGTSMIIDPNRTQQRSIMDVVYGYRFTYYNTAVENKSYWWSDKKPMIYTDTWGFFSSNPLNSNCPGEWKLSDIYDEQKFATRSPHYAMSKTFMLESITYPTGGKELFIYENHSYGKVYDRKSSTVITLNGTCGGLRVKTVKGYGNDGELKHIKNYHYKNSFFSSYTDTNVSSGIYKRSRCFSEKICVDPLKQCYLNIYSFDEMNPYPLNDNSPDVGYSIVFEEVLDNADNRITLTKFTFSNYDIDIYGNSHLDMSATNTLNVHGEYAFAPVTSLSFERGKLLSKEIWNADNILVSKEQLEYKRSTAQPTAIMNHENYIYYSWTFLGESNNLICNPQRVEMSYLNSVLTNRFDLSKKTVIEHYGSKSFRYDTAYEYTTYGSLQKETVTSGGAETITREYKYSFDEDSCKWLLKRNVLLPLEATISKEGDCSTERMHYGYTLTSDSIPYLRKKEVLYNKNGICDIGKVIFAVEKTDRYGNPIIIDENGIKTILIWGYWGTKILASIQHAKYEDVVLAINCNPEEMSDNIIFNHQICRADGSSHGHLVDYGPGEKYEISPQIELWYENLRNSLAGALINTYIYDGKLNLKKRTLADGTTSIYKYDKLNRLVEEQRLKGDKTEIIRKAEYNFSTIE